MSEQQNHLPDENIVENQANLVGDNFQDQQILSHLSGDVHQIPSVPFAEGATATQEGDAVEVTWVRVQNEATLNVTVGRTNTATGISEALYSHYGYMPPFYDWSAITDISYRYYVVFSSSGNVVNKLHSNVVRINPTSRPVFPIDFHKLDSVTLKGLIATLHTIEASRAGITEDPSVNSISQSSLGEQSLEN